MGSGNDWLDIHGTLNTSALHGGLTTIHGGGNLSVQTPVAGVYTGTIEGDRILVDGGGGPTSPLVIYGDTSQDASWYAGRPYDADVTDTFVLGPNPAQATAFYRLPRANPFDRDGNDVIDASADTAVTGALGADALGIVIYGGGGNDTIQGTQLGDVLAGGSGDDTIYGQGGDDQIYGDSGVNVDVITRVLSVPTANAARPANDNPSSNRDGLAAAKDTILGEAGDDVIFGDHGTVQQQLPPEQKLLNVRKLEDLRTARRRTAWTTRSTATPAATASSAATAPTRSPATPTRTSSSATRATSATSRATRDLSTLDLIESVDTAPAFGGVDHITDDASDDIILGGQSGDIIGAGAGNNLVFGDNGRITAAKTLLAGGNFSSQPITLGLVETIESLIGGDDDITTGIGKDIVLGGIGADTIIANDGETSGNDGRNLVLGDSGYLDWTADDTGRVYAATTAAAGTLPGDDSDASDIDRIFSTEPDDGGHDEITTGGGDDIVLGGEDMDTIVAGAGQNLVFGDSGQITAAATGAANFSTQPITLGLVETIESLIGGDDDITTGIGRDIVLGGIGADTIIANDGETGGNDGRNIVLGDSATSTGRPTTRAGSTPRPLRRPARCRATTATPPTSTGSSAPSPMTAARTRSRRAAATTSSSAARTWTRSLPATARTSSSATAARSPRRRAGPRTSARSRSPSASWRRSSR